MLAYACTNESCLTSCCMLFNDVHPLEELQTKNVFRVLSNDDKFSITHHPRFHCLIRCINMDIAVSMLRKTGKNYRTIMHGHKHLVSSCKLPVERVWNASL